MDKEKLVEVMNEYLPKKAGEGLSPEDCKYYLDKDGDIWIIDKRLTLDTCIARLLEYLSQMDTDAEDLRESINTFREEAKPANERDHRFEIGKTYTTRGGWPAKIISKSKDQGRMFAIHKPGDKFCESEPVLHNSVIGHAMTTLVSRTPPTYHGHPADILQNSEQTPEEHSDKTITTKQITRAQWYRLLEELFLLNIDTAKSIGTAEIILGILNLERPHE